MTKQIEEMAKATMFHCRIDNQCGSCHWSTCNECLSEALYNAGYRKSTDVAREIIKEMDDALHDMAIEYEKAGHPEYFAVCEMVHHKVIRPMEKKYESEGADDEMVD